MKKLLLALGTITAVAAPVAAVVACGSKEEHSNYGILSDIKIDTSKHNDKDADVLLAVTIDLTDKDAKTNNYAEEVKLLNKMTITKDTKFTIIWKDGDATKRETHNSKEAKVIIDKISTVIGTEIAPRGGSFTVVAKKPATP